MPLSPHHEPSGPNVCCLSEDLDVHKAKGEHVHARKTREGIVELSKSFDQRLAIRAFKLPENMVRIEMIGAL